MCNKCFIDMYSGKVIQLEKGKCIACGQSFFTNKDAMDATEWLITEEFYKGFSKLYRKVKSMYRKHNTNMLTEWAENLNKSDRSVIKQEAILLRKRMVLKKKSKKCPVLIFIKNQTYV